MNNLFISDSGEADWRRLLTPEERAWMLGDIARVSLAAGASLFPEQPWQDLDVYPGSLTAHKSPIERLAFIERILPILTRAIGQIHRFPVQKLVAKTRPIAPPVRARRVGTQAILQAARRGPSARHWDETVTMPSCDTPENRAVKSFGRILQKDSAAIARIADAEGESEAYERAVSCALQFQGLLAAAWWEQVTTDSEAWAKPPTQRAIARLPYAQIFAERSRYRKEFAFEWNQSLWTVPPRETWRSYETWCLFRALDALRVLGYAPAAGTDTFRLREGRLLITLAQGEPSRIRLNGPLGRRLSLSYNQTFAQGERSLSHTMQPDITVEEVASASLWILDAKFKAYALPGEETGDINQMHAYRDAITGPRGAPAVARAWCLYTGQAEATNRERITYGVSDGPVGALCLRPGSDAAFKNLCELLAAWLMVKPPLSTQPESPENISAHR